MMNPTPSNGQLAHALARLGLGVDIVPFAAGMQKEFEATFLPGMLVYGTGFVIVIGEASIGLLLILGWHLRLALIAGALLMILLLFGVSLLQKWDVAGLQLSYLAFYAGLLATVSYDRFSIDGLRRRRTPSQTAA